MDIEVSVNTRIRHEYRYVIFTMVPIQNDRKADNKLTSLNYTLYETYESEDGATKWTYSQGNEFIMENDHTRMSSVAYTFSCFMKHD